MYVAFSDAALEAAVQVELVLGVVERARLARLQQLLLGGFDQVGSTLTVLDAQELPAFEAVHLDSDARGHQGQEEDAKGSAPPLGISVVFSRMLCRFLPQHSDVFLMHFDAFRCV